MEIPHDSGDADFATMPSNLSNEENELENNGG